MPDPAVSVVIPTYERPGSLRRALEAVSRCDPPAGGFEVIVVDDGSTVDLGPVVADLEGVRLLRQANAGPAAARNTGWRAARGEVVAFTDDDTIPTGGWVVGLHRAFVAAPVMGAGGPVEPLTPGFVSTFVQLERLVGHGVDPDGTVRYLVTANAAYRRAALESVGGFDERFAAPAGEDVDLSRRITEQGGRLVIAHDAVVRHEHRTGVGDILRTYHRHGKARVALAARHPADSVGGGAARALAPGAWARSWRGARSAGESRPAAAVHLLLRAAGLAAFGAGAWRAR